MTKNEAAIMLNACILGLTNAGCSAMDIVEILQERKVKLCEQDAIMSRIKITLNQLQGEANDIR